MTRFTRFCLCLLATASASIHAGGLPTLTPTPFGFGDVAVGGISAAQIFTLHNPTDEVLTIVSVDLGGFAPQHYTLGMNTCVGAIVPAGSCTVSVTFTPDAPGHHAALVRLFYTAPSLPAGAERNVTLSGSGVSADPGPIQPVPAIGDISLVFGVLLMMAGAWLSRRRDVA